MTNNHQDLTRIDRSEMSPASIVRREATQQHLSFTDLTRMFVRRKAPIVVVAAIVFCAAGAYAFLKTPSYEGVARLQIDPTRSSNLGLDDSDKSTSSSPDTDSRVATEVTIIHSNTVASQVMQSLKLYTNPQFAGGDTVGTGITEFSQLAPSQQERMFARFDDNLTVKVIPNTQVVEIRFRSPDPTLAAGAANSVIDEYMERNFHARVDGTAQISHWLATEMENIKANTTVAQQNLADFEKANNLLGVDESNNIVTDRLKLLNEELTQAEADRIVKEGRYRLASSSDAELVAAIVPGTTLQVLRTQQADLQAQYAQLNSKFGVGYPKLRELQSQLDQLNAAIQTEGGNVNTRLANEYNAAAKAESMIRDDFDRQKSDAYKLNAHSAQYAELKHEVESGQQLYDTLQLKLKEAGIASGLNTSFVGVIDRAQLPDTPVSPKKGLDLAIGLGAGLACGLMLGFVLDSFDDTVGSTQDLHDFTALPELVSVPFLTALSKKQIDKLKRGGLFVSLPSAFTPIALREPSSPAVESYRALCNIILRSSAQNSTKVLLITSATPSEGKSTVSCNLATALAQRGRKVLMVDADLRSSSPHSHVGISNHSLTAMCLSGTANHPRYQPIASLPTLHVLPAGIRPTDPTGILDSARMQELMTAWRAEYEHIIIDTPPVLLFADALVLATASDAVILVTRSGVSRRHEVVRAKDLLTRSGAHILGFILNAVKSPEYYYGYPASYGPQYAPGNTEAEKKTNDFRG